MAQNIDVTWLEQKLSQNGFTFSDLADQTGISVSDLKQIAKSGTAPQEQWDVILSTLNDYPAVRYPDASILEQLNSDIAQAGGEGSCIIYYGAQNGNLVFTGYRNLADLAYHGSDVNTQYLSQLNTNLLDALTLFTRQNTLI